MNYLPTPIANHEMYTLYPDGTIHSGKVDKILSPIVQPNGYVHVTLDGEQLAIHRLVALHFIPNPYGYNYVNHKNGIKSDNRVDNIEWVNAEQNSHHAWETGLNSHITTNYIHVDTKRDLIQRVLKGELISDLAVEVGKRQESLSKSLRERAIKDGLESAWTAEMKRRRKLTAKRNLEKVNARNII